jgi:WD40 repeat protein
MVFTLREEIFMLKKCLVLVFTLCVAALFGQEAADVEVFAQLGHRSMVCFAAFSPDGQRIVSGSADKTIKIWDVESGREIRTLSGHGNYVECVAWSPDGRRIISGSRDKREVIDSWEETFEY